jgi:hypothetical protein
MTIQMPEKKERSKRLKIKCMDAWMYVSHAIMHSCNHATR